MTARVALRIGYTLDYTHLERSDATGAAFVAPASQIAQGVLLALDGQRRGWDGTIWWNPARRAGWRPWGRPAGGDYEPADRDYQRYGATLARSITASPRLVGRVELSAMGGHDLDRFSRFTFGAFDTRLRGYPSALIRYDRGAVARTTLAWSASRLLRVDGFADTAWVHDPGFGSGLSRFTGLGAAAKCPLRSGRSRRSSGATASRA